MKNMKNMKNSSLQSIREKRELLENKKNQKLKEFLEKVKKEMVINNVYHKKAKFSCFSDNIFTYVYSNHTLMFEFNVICDDTILDKMTIKELLQLKRIKYFDNGIYNKKTREKLGGIFYSICNDDETKNIELYKDLTSDLTDEDFPDGVYISEGVYLQSDGTFECFD